MKTFLKIYLLIVLLLGSHFTFAGACITICKDGCRIAANTTISAKPKQQFALDLLNLNNNFPNVEKSVVNTQNAITIEESDFNTFSAIGNSWVEFASNNKTFSLNVGTANTSSPQTWTLPSNFMSFFTGFGRSDFISPSSIPNDLQIAGADRVLKNFKLDTEGNPMIEYEHFDIGTTYLNHLGTSYDLANGGDNEYDEPDYELLDVPLNLGDSFTYTIDEDDYVTGLNLQRFVETNTVDAYGTITTPDGTFNCLRMSYVTQAYTRPNESASFTQVSTMTGIAFITKEGHYFYGRTAAVSGTTLVSNFYYKRVVTTSTLSETDEVRINNDSKGVTINTDNSLADLSAILEVSSTNKGVLFPRIAMANRPVYPATGLLIYQIDNTAGFYFFDGTDWRMLTANMPSSMTSNVRTSIIENLNITGKSQLKKGIAFIKFDNPPEDFENIQIDVRLEGDCKGLYISKKTREGFEVKELQKGKSNAKFSWEIR